MIKLSDTQAILLAAAAQRGDGSLLPLPTALKPGGGATRAIDVLITHGLAEERDTADADAVRRVEEDRRIGLFITATGAAAIGVTLPGADEVESGGAEVLAPAAPHNAAGKAPAKTSIVLDLMRRPVGATLAELIAVTGWLPHTTRAALTGLRKKGHDITRGKRDGVTFYVAASK